MWQCMVCGSSNTGDATSCASCGAARPQSAILPSDPPVSWPASAPADAFGSWSPAAGQPHGAPPPHPAFPTGPEGAGAPSQPPGPPASGPPAQQWPVSGPPADPSLLAADNWPGAGPGLGHQPPPWATQLAAGPDPSGRPVPWSTQPAGPGPDPGGPPVPWSTQPAGPGPDSGGPPVPWSTQPAGPGPDSGGPPVPWSAQPAAAGPDPGGRALPWATQLAAADPGLGDQPPWSAAAPGVETPWHPPPAYPQPRPRPVWIFPAIVALVLLLAGGTVAFVMRDTWLPGGTPGPTTGPTGAAGPTGDPTAGPSATATGGPTNGPTPTAAPTTAGPPTLPATVGSVKLDPSLDPARAPAVAAVFDRYFTAVNARNAGAALGAMDPNGSINQGDAGAVKRFTDGISTSSDDDIALLALGPDPTGKGVLQARVTFRSRQQAGKGPKGRESETCTRWDVTYSITQPGGEYRIWGSTNAGSRPC
ncbi:hypothetical protein [Dactylosporangium matsuzakiense]|uniref:RanBP2-type domain-containing protein n=1 Tax=Dactylosporangium matsuzakiense TaxID=53360 RepID=A0A9W6NLZ7_9ACTN|nr:hypothetical protein [Dactylosporangium matsuzakiense]GLL01392.1 hypothetical protein GCM10017581_031330 [Dactylosporangium matsuzakiense]